MSIKNGMSAAKVYQCWYSIKISGDCCLSWRNENGLINMMRDMGISVSDSVKVQKIDKSKPFSKLNCAVVPIKHRGGVKFPIKFEGDDAYTEAAGVYKLTFPTGHYYIGSTKNFRVRLKAYLAALGPNYKDNKSIRAVCQEVRSAVFTVLHVTEVLEAKEHEDKVINAMFGDPMLLNRARSAFSNKGIKWTKEEIEKTSQNGRFGRMKKPPEREAWDKDIDGSITA